PVTSTPFTVKERQAAEQRLARAHRVAHEPSDREGVGDFAALSADGDLRQPGGAAGAKHRGAILRGDDAIGVQPVAVLGGNERPEIVHGHFAAAASYRLVRRSGVSLSSLGG